MVSILSREPDVSDDYKPREMRWFCTECNHHSAGGEGQKAIILPHPKTGALTVHVLQCAECGEVNCFVNICDEPGCTREASCGWPTRGMTSYRRTCGEHMIAAATRGEEATPEERRAHARKIIEG
jgi:hypothetical protein